jgi:phosphoribosylanthranilate isomerase
MPHRTRIKFCGIMRVEDAVLAAELGADAIGMLLHANSKRRISRQLAKEILAVLPPFVTPVGLFVDAPPALIRETVDELGLRHVQLHGQEQPRIVEQLPGRVIVKAIHISRGQIEQALAPWRNVPQVRGLLLETANPSQPGGTGIENDWSAIREHQQRGGFEGMPPIIAAGGLRPETVAEVIRSLRPFAVDVSSGIESEPGVKSKQKMTDFIAAVRDADSA